MNNDQDTLICGSDELKSGGAGFKFTVVSDSQQIPAFVIRYEDEVHGYLNKCAHMMLELDWDDAEFFDTSGDYLICANHGAMFDPKTGLCVNGPCYGASLDSISVSEAGSNIYMDDARYQIDKAGD